MHSLRYDDGPVTVELVKTDDGWRVTATTDETEILPPFDLSNYKPASAFMQAMRRIEQAKDRGTGGLRDAAATVKRINARVTDLSRARSMRAVQR